MRIDTVGFPRSGNTWLTHLLADTLSASLHDTDGNEVRAGNSDYQIHKSHSFDSLSGPTIYIQRDPRDVAVSSMHYRCLDSIQDVLAGKDAKSDHLGFDQYERFVRAWRPRLGSKKVLFTSYEDLHGQWATEIIWFVASRLTNATIDFDKVRRAHARNSFEQARQRTDNHHALWRGEIGTWREFFTRETGETFDTRLGHLLLELGYIKDRNWWKEL